MSELERSRARRRWYWLLLLPAAGIFYPPLYASAAPALWGFPFFYWYQFVWITLSAVIIGAVYLLTRSSRGDP
jgi:hypothetical protein